MMRGAVRPSRAQRDEPIERRLAAIEAQLAAMPARWAGDRQVGSSQSYSETDVSAGNQSATLDVEAPSPATPGRWTIDSVWATSTTSPITVDVYRIAFRIDTWFRGGKCHATWSCLLDLYRWIGSQNSIKPGADSGISTVGSSLQVQGGAVVTACGTARFAWQPKTPGPGLQRMILTLEPLTPGGTWSLATALHVAWLPSYTPKPGTA